MKIITLNTNGIRSAFRKGFVNWAKKENPDILCIQEAKADSLPTQTMFEPHLNDIYRAVINPAQKKGYSGVIVFSKDKPIEVSKGLGLERFDSEGRVLKITFPEFLLINVYMPHGRRDKGNLEYKLESFRYLINLLRMLKKENVILLGDLNIAHNEIDLARPKQNINNVMFTREERDLLDEIVDFGFVDAYRFLNPTVSAYTWWPYSKSAREKNIGWRLDYLFVSHKLKGKLKNSFILREIFLSDHCPTGIEINI